MGANNWLLDVRGSQPSATLTMVSQGAGPPLMATELEPRAKGNKTKNVMVIAARMASGEPRDA